MNKIKKILMLLCINLLIQRSGTGPQKSNSAGAKEQIFEADCVLLNWICLFLLIFSMLLSRHLRTIYNSSKFLFLFKVTRHLWWSRNDLLSSETWWLWQYVWLQLPWIFPLASDKIKCHLTWCISHILKYRSPKLI